MNESAKRSLRDLFVISAGGLFLELVLIRLLASEIRIFAYFKNFPLLAAFIGLGLGCYVADKRPVRLWLSAALVFLLSLSAVFSEPLHLSNLFFPDPALYIFRGSILSPNLISNAQAYPLVGHLYGHISTTLLMVLIGVVSFAIIGVLFAATAMVFFPIGQLTGALFGRVPPLRAYSVNVGGALAGSLLFTLVSYLELGPLFWLLPPLALLAYFAWGLGKRPVVAISLGTAVLLAIILPHANVAGQRLVWSPYYRINLVPGTPETAGVPNGDDLGWTLRVNHDYFQRAVDLRPAAIARAPRLEWVAKAYDLPYQLLGEKKRVLVVGSGMGNDVAAALRAGSGRVTAVEIDPAIIRLGKELHPEHSLADPRTTVVNNDARAFFHKNANGRGDAGKFDLIVFGLLDSQTALSSMSSVRLEFYVYTLESMREALSLLDKDHGIVAISFSVGWRDWVGARMFRTIAEAAGADPLAIGSKYDEGVTFIAGPGLAKIDRARLAALGAVDLTAKYAQPARPCTDDWPFLYVNPDHWPWVYLMALALLMIVGSRLVWRAMGRVAPIGSAEARGPRFDFHMFLMGAAFMLVETGAIARLSLVFGATWLVNAAVISAVLLMVLGSNALVIARRAPSLGTSYVALCASLVLVFAIPLGVFVAMPAGWLFASLLVAMPVFFSGIIFSETFAQSPSAHLALGCNMLGALLGGALEAASLAIGIRALSLLALLIYTLSAAIVSRRTQRPSRRKRPPMTGTDLPLPQPEDGTADRLIAGAER
jgi:hypothetical protein